MRQPPIILHIREVCEARGVRLRDLEHLTHRSKSYWQRVWADQAEVGSRALGASPGRWTPRRTC